MRNGILLFALAAFATVGLQAANTNDQSSKGTLSNAGSSASAGPKENASRLGLDMLDQTNKARLAISKKDKQVVLQHIQTATNDLAKARKDSLGNNIPLYQEFASVTVIAPVRAEQKKEAAQSNSSANKSVPAAVHQVAGGYSVMELDSTGALAHLNAAKTAVEKGDWNAADNDLAAVQDGVVFASYQSDLPLVRAQENLILARDSARKGNYKEVHAALTSAAKALSNYETSGGSHANDAKNMQQQIQNYNAHVTQDHSDAVSKINGWWNTASDWLQSPKNSA